MTALSGVALIRHYFPDLNADQLEKFRIMGELYTGWNEKVNVISRKDIGFLYEKHVLHSLAIAHFIRFAPGSVILDIGTGGGFPGIPLAVFFPEVKFILIDSIAKKIKVVEDVASQLKLDNVVTSWIRSENFRGQVDFIVSRAVAPFPDLISWSIGKILKINRNSRPNGLICLKGGDLIEELKDFCKQVEISDLHDWFPEAYFLEKKLIYRAF
jgi:16S rRNA (guanine527-N7)-methyltransferase